MAGAGTRTFAVPGVAGLDVKVQTVIDEHLVEPYYAEEADEQ